MLMNGVSHRRLWSDLNTIIRIQKYEVMTDLTEVEDLKFYTLLFILCTEIILLYCPGFFEGQPAAEQ